MQLPIETPMKTCASDMHSLTVVADVAAGDVDLVQVAREQIYLNLPLKSVCRDDCKGLCATCGANRNRIECACSGDQPDPRLAPLLELKKRLGDH